MPPSSSTPSTTSTATATPTPAPIAPPPGTTLHAGGDRGSTTVIPSVAGTGFSILSELVSNTGDLSTVTAYDAAGATVGVVGPGKFTGSCGATDVVTPGGRRLIVAQLITKKAAQGIIPESYSLDVLAWDPSTGQQVWSSNVVKDDSKNQAICFGIEPTFDGAVGVSDGPNGGDGKTLTFTVDLSTGQLQLRPDLLGVVANWVLTGTPDGNPSTQVSYTVLDATGATVGNFEGTGAGNSRNPDLIPFPVANKQVVVGPVVSESQGGVATTPDGTLYFAGKVVNHDSGPQTNQITAYSLPSMSTVWTVDSNTTSISGSTNDRIIVNSDDGAQALDAHTGAVQWSIPVDLDVCGVTASQMLVLANDQLAVIDMSNGQQLSYQPAGLNVASGEGECPNMLQHGVAYGADTKVVQMLKP